MADEWPRTKSQVCYEAIRPIAGRGQGEAKESPEESNKQKSERTAEVQTMLFPPTMTSEGFAPINQISSFAGKSPRRVVSSGSKFEFFDPTNELRAIWPRSPASSDQPLEEHCHQLWPAGLRSPLSLPKASLIRCTLLWRKMLSASCQDTTWLLFGRGPTTVPQTIMG
jgi:hypothetical protein